MSQVYRVQLFLGFILLLDPSRIGRTDGIAACDSKIWCDGQLLHDVQTAGIFNDSKTFVDMNINRDPDDVINAYTNLKSQGKPNKEQLKTFVETYFEGPGNEFEPWTPTDYVEKPRFLEKIKDKSLRDFGAALCKIWSNLGRTIKADVNLHPDRYSILYLDNPFIVPGGRFREIYYWDSYWVVKGLLVCEMESTVRGMLENLMSFIKSHGLVPNGGRIYYTRRSQPPLLIPMVDMYLTATNDTDFIKQNSAYLQREFEYWNMNRSIHVQKDIDHMYVMNRYATSITKPRPESYKEDLHTVGQRNLSEADAEQLYSNIASAAESGWDFSSRWFSRDFNNSDDRGKWLGYTDTKNVVPVDLNSIMCWNEGLLAKFHTLLDGRADAQYFQQRHDSRAKSVRELFWNEKAGIWFDHHLNTNDQNERFYPSNVFPLFVGCLEKDVNRSTIERNVLRYLQNVGVLQDQSGIPTSLLETGQQWDYPNAWPPLQHVIITALADSTLPESRRVALELAQKWVKSNWMGWTRTKHMFEKYVVTAEGSRGSGGEYNVQEGFGWTNGVLLDLLDRFGGELHVDSKSTNGACSFEYFRMRPLHFIFIIVTIYISSML